MRALIIERDRTAPIRPIRSLIRQSRFKLPDNYELLKVDSNPSIVVRIEMQTNKLKF